MIFHLNFSFSNLCFLIIIYWRSLRQKNFPYRRGNAANEVGSDLKRYFDFIFSCVLQNTFKIYLHFNHIQCDRESLKEFSSFCVALSEELFKSTLWVSFEKGKILKFVFFFLFFLHKKQKNLNKNLKTKKIISKRKKAKKRNEVIFFSIFFYFCLF